MQMDDAALERLLADVLGFDENTLVRLLREGWGYEEVLADMRRIDCQMINDQ